QFLHLLDRLCDHAGRFASLESTPSLTTSTVPLLRKSSLSVFEPAVSTTSRARCFTTGKPASFLSIVATSGISEGMGRSLFRFPTTKPVAPRQTRPPFHLEVYTS